MTPTSESTTGHYDANGKFWPCTHPVGCQRCNWCGFRAVQTNPRTPRMLAEAFTGDLIESGALQKCAFQTVSHVFETAINEGVAVAVEDVERQRNLYHAIIVQIERAIRFDGMLSHLPEAVAVLRDALDKLAVHPTSEYHEDYGAVLWWHFPVCEPPLVGHGPGAGERNADGAPTACALGIESGWLTHWSRIPIVWNEKGQPK